MFKVKKTEIINSRVLKTSNGKTMLLSKFAICVNKKSRFMKEQKAKGRISSFCLKTPLRKILLSGDILF